MIETPMEVEMLKTVHLIKRVIDEKISETIDKELTVPQAHLIGFIHKKGENDNVYQKDIENAFELHRSSVSLMLNNMERQGLIKRLSVPDDARLKKIVLTKKAIDLQEKIEKSIHEVDERITKNIDDVQMKLFLDTLKKMRMNIK